MRNSWIKGLWGLGLVLLYMTASPAYGGPTSCTMRFTLKGWSAFYETAHGSGTVKCDNGQSAKVTIQSKGGGLTFGKSKVANGVGRFSEITDISEVFGSYAVADTHAGMGKSADAQVLTKGYVSLALSGTGQGVSLGFDFGKFTITKAK